LTIKVQPIINKKTSLGTRMEPTQFNIVTLVKCSDHLATTHCELLPTLKI
jgi:hypothetical protein